MRRIVLGLLALLIVSAAGAAPAVPASLQGVSRIVIMGDSITQGGGGPGGYVTLIQERLTKLYPEQNIEVINAGISGHKSNDMLARFARDVLDKHPQLVTINVGINDVWHGFSGFGRGPDYPQGNGPNGISLETYRENVGKMVDAAQKAGIRVALVSPTVIYENLSSPENAKLLRYVRGMREVASQHGCGFIDLNSPFREVIAAYQKRAGHGTNLLTVDGVHMNPAGNRMMATLILRGLGVPVE